MTSPVGSSVPGNTPRPESAEQRYQWWSQQPTEHISDALLTLPPSDCTAEILRGVLRDRKHAAGNTPISDEAVEAGAHELHRLFMAGGSDWWDATPAEAKAAGLFDDLDDHRKYMRFQSSLVLHAAAPLLVSAEAERRAEAEHLRAERHEATIRATARLFDLPGGYAYDDLPKIVGAALAESEGWRLLHDGAEIRADVREAERDDALGLVEGLRAELAERDAELLVRKMFLSTVVQQRDDARAKAGDMPDRCPQCQSRIWTETMDGERSCVSCGKLRPHPAVLRAAGGQEKPGSETLWSAIHRVLWDASLPGDRAAIDELTGTLVAAVLAAAPVGGQHVSAGSAVEAEPSDDRTAQLRRQMGPSPDATRWPTAEEWREWYLALPADRQLRESRRAIADARVAFEAESRPAAAVSGEQAQPDGETR